VNLDRQMAWKLNRRQPEQLDSSGADAPLR
jgi:hypothetical protein